MSDEISLSQLVKLYTLKSVVKSLPSQQAGSRCLQKGKEASEKSAAGEGLAQSTNELQLRDITEDDDGYHPYADVPDMRPLFECNPWD